MYNNSFLFDFINVSVKGIIYLIILVLRHFNFIIELINSIENAAKVYITYIIKYLLNELIYQFQLFFFI